MNGSTCCPTAAADVLEAWLREHRGTGGVCREGSRPVPRAVGVKARLRLTALPLSEGQDRIADSDSGAVVFLCAPNAGARKTATAVKARTTIIAVRRL